MQPLTNAQSHDKPRRILLMVTGGTPQIVTETLYYLACCATPRFIPTEIRIITTTIGKEKIIRNLLDEDTGWFQHLLEDYDLPAMDFSAEHILLIPDTATGQPLTDIRSPQENEYTADFITQCVHEYTQDDNSAIHVSLAGGRKTMSYYVGYALSLFRRPQDKLSHTLVDASLESRWDFFYPRPDEQAEQNKITLAEIPFVRLREILPDELKGLETNQVAFSAVVKQAQQTLEPPSLIIDYSKKQIQLHTGEKLALKSAELTFYGWIARRRMEQRDGPQRPIGNDAKQWKEVDQALYEKYLKELEAEWERCGVPSKTGIGLRAVGGLTERFFDQRRTKVNAALQEGNPMLAPAYQIYKTDENQYSLNIPPDRISIIDDWSDF